VRTLRRGTPVRCSLAGVPLHAEVFDRQMPREHAMGVVYVRASADHPIARKGDRLYVRVCNVQRRAPRAHAAHLGRLRWSPFGRRHKAG